MSKYKSKHGKTYTVFFRMFVGFRVWNYLSMKHYRNIVSRIRFNSILKVCNFRYLQTSRPVTSINCLYLRIRSTKEELWFVQGPDDRVVESRRRLSYTEPKRSVGSTVVVLDFYVYLKSNRQQTLGTKIIKLIWKHFTNRVQKHNTGYHPFFWLFFCMRDESSSRCRWPFVSTVVKFTDIMFCTTIATDFIYSNQLVNDTVSM